VYKDIQKKLLEKNMTRREFLQFTGGSILVLFGLGNLIALLTHMKKTAEPTSAATVEDVSHGFGSRKFGA
jgi:hypothetical protein